MRRRLVTGIVLTLLLTGMLTLAFNIQPVRASGTVYIRADGSVEPEGTPISSIDNVTYTFTDNIYDEIVVERDNIVVDGAGCTLKGTGARDSKGIDLTGRSNVTIKNTKIGEFWYGILLYSSSNNTISGNNITNNSWSGISLEESSSNTISGNSGYSIYGDFIDLWHSSNNTISGNSGYSIWLDESSNNSMYGNTGHSIYLWHSSNNTISGNYGDSIWLDGSSNNSMYGNTGHSIYLLHSSNNSMYGNYGDGIRLDGSSNNSMYGNTITNGDGIRLDGSSNNSMYGNTITENSQDGISLGLSSNNSISGNTITNNSEDGIRFSSLGSCNFNTISQNNITENSQYGIWLWGSSNTINGNKITNNGGSIWLGRSSNNTISGNKITNNEGGIELYAFCSSNNISQNNITKNYGHGILLDASLGPSDFNTISGNGITQNFGHGIYLRHSSNNTISGNGITQNYAYGISLGLSSNNSMYGNTITGNGGGIVLGRSSNNSIYHNNLMDNTQQVSSYVSTNVWDDGYPSGGNFWSDHVTVDDCCGENQDEPGSDGIVDEPYVIDDFNRDNYPLAEPWSPAVSATVDIDPDTLNLKSKGEWVTCYVELPEGHNVSDIDVHTVMLNGTIPVSLLEMPAPQPVPTEVGDYDNDTIPDLMVKIGRAEVASWICSGLGIQHGNVTLAITGELSDGTPFEGTCTIKVLFPGDADDDGDADFDDFAILAGCYGTSVGNPCYSPLADFDEDGHVRYDDFLILAGNYGKTGV